MSDFLDIWFEDVPAGAYGYSCQHPGGRFTNGAVETLEALAAAIAREDAAGATGVWFRTTTLADVPMSGRGTVEDTLAVPGVWADIDVAGPGHKHAGLPADEDAAFEVLRASGLPVPTAVLRTGGGLSAWWKYNEALLDTEQAAVISKHVHALLTAGSPGVKIDNVSDLARVMRAPETTNRKPGVNAACTVLSCEGLTFPPQYIGGLPLPRRAAPVPVPASLLDEPTRDPATPRDFTLKAARAYCRPAIERLEHAPDGEINVRLNEAAKVLSHFGPEFWPRDKAEAWLTDALAHTAYDATTWLAEDTIRSAYTSAFTDWKAVRTVDKDAPVVIEFTDASLSEYVADEVLRARYVRTRGFGWMKWSGKLWRVCDDGAPVEAVRKFVKAKLIAAIRADGVGSVVAKGWAKYNGAGKISAVVSLAGNIDGILRDASEFDQYPDLINTPDGVLELRSGELRAHAPELLLTKITNASYRPGSKPEAVAAILDAIPIDSLEWLQRHLGAGVSGRPKPRMPALLLTGIGRNGKSVLMETVLQALGGIDGEGYAVQVPNELLLMGKAAGGATPERLMLRGARFAYIEETPEGRYLDTGALKKVIGTGVTSGRALYKDVVTFKMHHILVINTNYPPRVTETDTATWDRLTALRFPWRYRKPNDDLGEWDAATDRRGDPTLSEALQRPENLDGLFTWLVDGFRAGETYDVSTPVSVKESVAEWRKDGDTILRFLEDVYEFDAESWVTTGSLYAALRRWHEVQGQQKPPPMHTFISRLKDHTGLKSQLTVRRTLTELTGLSLPSESVWIVAGAECRKPEGRQTMGVHGLRYRNTVPSGAILP